jgi:hypothetical protein
MQSPSSKQLFEEASDLLDSITQETNRPFEDLVTYLVCPGARISIGKFLSSYIIAHGGEIGVNDTNLELFNRCIEIEPGFRNIPLDTLNCNRGSYEDGSVYCLSHDKTSSCYEVAKQVRDFILEKSA